MKKNVLAILVFAINALLLFFAPNFQEIELNPGLTGIYFLQSLWSRPVAPAGIVDIEIDNNTFVRQPEIRDCLAKYQGAVDIRCFSRRLHSQLIEKLYQQGASLIVFNVFFRESRGDEDVALADAIRKAGNVLLQSYQSIRFLGQDMKIVDINQPVPILADSAASAPLPVSDNQAATPHFWLFLNFIHLENRIGQNYIQPILPVLALHLLVLEQYRQPFLHSLSAQNPEMAGFLAKLAPDYNHQPIMTAIIERLSILARHNPDWAKQAIATLEQQPALSISAKQTLQALFRLYQADNDMYLNAYGPVKTVQTIAYEQVGQMLRKDPGFFRGKVVFIGPSLEYGRATKGGSFTTPFGEISSTELLATTFANLRDGVTLKPPDTGLSRIAASVCAVLVMISILCLRLWRAVFVLVLAGLLYLAIVVQLFHYQNIWLPWLLVSAQLGIGIAALFIDHYFKLGDLIKRRLPWGLASTVNQSKIEENRKAAQQPGIAMATDNSGYTRLAEIRGEQWLGQFMDDYQAMAEAVVRSYDGAVKDWAGDGMTALWLEMAAKNQDQKINKLIPQLKPGAYDIRKQALAAALGLIEKSDHFTKVKDVLFPLRIGMSYGPLWISLVGEFKVFGDTINVAHRLEGLNKITNTRILVNKAMMADQTDFIFRRVGCFPLHNHEPIDVYELMGMDSLENKAKQILAFRFEAALAAYEKQDWQTAMAAFADILAGFPEDGPAEYYYRLCVEKLSGENAPEAGE